MNECIVRMGGGTPPMKTIAIDSDWALMPQNPWKRNEFWRVMRRPLQYKKIILQRFSAVYRQGVFRFLRLRKDGHMHTSAACGCRYKARKLSCLLTVFATMFTVPFNTTALREQRVAARASPRLFDLAFSKPHAKAG